ncbi:hypothetical protein AZE42_13354 [Rhizopogon vesiculosus]|uniref:Uncharacterized protein n=1 Tax=Rhizopogon vesiculosus TaxID=180088 RepID=A0A1J8QWP0_9AGAM|nr:hypothetical protein AZE42_13354 [Rhizopogon vesiculosus]
MATYTHFSYANIISQNNTPKKRHIRDPLHSEATSRPPAAHCKLLPLRPSSQ